MLDQLDAYESPHKMPMYPMSGAFIDAHHTWYQAREYYATAPIGEEGDYAREVYMSALLASVTETNPPTNRIDLNPPIPPKPERAPRQPMRGAYLFLLIYLTVIILWVLIIVSVA